jgi:broad specificity phosphatase PhoE
MTSNGVQRIVVVRHGETEWSRDRRHTGRTDIPLTEHGREQAQRLRGVLQSQSFALVLTSPLQRSRETCALAGFGDIAEVEPQLVEWDYGACDGRTTEEIRREHPGWNLWDDGPFGGETLDEVGARADAVLRRIRSVDGDALLFAHGHILRVLTARWIEQPPRLAQRLQLLPAAPSVLGHEHEWTCITEWNVAPS